MSAKSPTQPARHGRRAVKLPEQTQVCSRRAGQAQGRWTTVSAGSEMDAAAADNSSGLRGNALAARRRWQVAAMCVRHTLQPAGARAGRGGEQQGPLERMHRTWDLLPNHGCATNCRAQKRYEKPAVRGAGSVGIAWRPSSCPKQLGVLHLGAVCNCFGCGGGGGVVSGDLLSGAGKYMRWRALAADPASTIFAEVKGKPARSVESAQRRRRHRGHGRHSHWCCNGGKPTPASTTRPLYHTQAPNACADPVAPAMPHHCHASSLEGCAGLAR